MLPVASPPTVSVVIPAHNYAGYLPDAIGSALAVDYPGLEIVVVDDGSTDGTPEVLRRFGDRVKALRLDGRGVSVARNTGLAAAGGEAIVFLDADDLLLPPGLRAAAAVLAERPEVDAVYGAWYACDVRTGEWTREESRVRPDAVIPTILLVGNVVTTPSAVLVRRRALERAGGFDPSLSFAADWDLWIRLALAGCRFVRVPEPVAIYRVHGASMTRNVDRAHRELRTVLERHLAHPALAGNAPVRAAAEVRIMVYAGRLWLEQGDEPRGVALLRDAVQAEPQQGASFAFHQGIVRALWRRARAGDRPDLRAVAAHAVEVADAAGGQAALAWLAAALQARMAGAWPLALRALGAALRASWRTVLAAPYRPVALRAALPPGAVRAAKRLGGGLRRGGGEPPPALVRALMAEAVRPPAEGRA